MRTKLIIVFGISGVGKTTICAEFAQKHQGIVHFSASNLLGLDRLSASTRSIEDALQDQQRLVATVVGIREALTQESMILDAHSLIEIEGSQLKIPSEIIAAMKPDGLVFLQASAKTVRRQRAIRGDKNISEIGFDDLEAMQLAALRAVQCYAGKLSCPLVIVESDQAADLDAAFGSLT